MALTMQDTIQDSGLARSMAALDLLWTIPPIQDAIASNLSIQDLSHCCMVSHSFSQWSTPFLWKHVQVGHSDKTRHLFDTKVPWRHHSQVRTLRTHRKPASLPSHYGTMLAFPNLTHLTYDMDETSETGIDNLVDFLSTHPALQSLKVSKVISNPSWITLSDTILAHPSLSTLDMEARGDVTASFLELLQGCRRLHSLMLMVRHGRVYSGSTAIRADTVGLMDTTLKKVNIRCVGIYYSGGKVAHFLRRCPLLESVSLSMSLGAASVALLLQSLVDGCPLLQHVHVHALRCSGVSLASLVQHCRHLHSLCYAVPGDNHLIAEAMMRHGCPSLQSLDVKYGIIYSLRDLFLVFGACPKLQSFKGRIELSLGDMTADQLELYSQMRWVCSGLLSLELSMYVPLISEGSIQEVLDLLYSRIGSMTALQDLDLLKDRFSDDNRCRVLYRQAFVKLAGLKDLEDFTFQDWDENVDGVITEDDLVELVKQWPRLLRLAGKFPYAFVGKDSEVRRRLCELRPGLVLHSHQ